VARAAATTTTTTTTHLSHFDSPARRTNGRRSLLYTFAMLLRFSTRTVMRRPGVPPLTAKKYHRRYLFSNGVPARCNAAR
jgi:hypothetical protein